MKKKRTTIWLDDVDRQFIALMKETYGVSSNSDALRLALRLLAKANTVPSNHLNLGIEEESRR